MSILIRSIDEGLAIGRGENFCIKMNYRNEKGIKGIYLYYYAYFYKKSNLFDSFKKSLRELF
ncbi:TPA: hypothetical protein DCZ36_03855, partial [Candidatus Gracilibacteria bacterium]|nr:hypothetical protein [Candidatus Gracilibacteria bacterium]